MDGASDSPAARLRIRVRWLSGGLFLEYSGRPEDLLAAGAATPEMLQTGRRGQRRFDADGDPYNLTRQYNTGRVVISRWKSPARATGLPGVQGSITAHEATSPF